MTMSDLEKPPLAELVHFGVLGMHWGKHKLEESVDVSTARNKVAEQKLILDQELKKQNRETGYGILAPSLTTVKAVDAATREHNYAKQDLSNAKILARVNSQEKSKTQIATEEKYKAKGMSDDEAAVAAYQHIKTKQVLATVGAIALTAAAGYAAYKIYDDRVDKIVKSGTLLQHIAPDDNLGVRDAFYSSHNKSDKSKYIGMYGRQLKTKHGGAFKKEIEVLSDIKQASPNNAHKILSDLIKNDAEFAAGVNKYVSRGTGLGNATYVPKVAKAKKSLTKGIVDKNVYEVFNASLVDHNNGMQPLTDKFFKALSDQGYNAIKDVNDSKYSGYKSLSPLITFDSENKVKVVDVRTLGEREISRHALKSYGSLLGSELVKDGAMITGAILAGNTIGKTNKETSDTKLAAEYRKKNPGTKLTNTEIVRMTERGQ